MKFNHYIFGIVLVAGSLAACDIKTLSSMITNSRRCTSVANTLCALCN